MLTVYCLDENDKFISLEYSKKRFLSATNSFTEFSETDPIYIPQTKSHVELFLNFLNDYTLPELNFNKEKPVDDMVILLDIAQFCGLSKNTTPGRNFMLDLIYDKICEKYIISKKLLSEFIEGLYLKMYEYDTCKIILEYRRKLVWYKAFKNHDAFKKNIVSDIRQKIDY